jgi:hypothetical protein
MAVEGGLRVGWDEALASDLALAPDLDAITPSSSAPVGPDAAGRYPVAVPGLTPAL